MLKDVLMYLVSITYNVRYALAHVIKMRYLLDQKDSNILYIIRDLFGFGNVTIRSKPVVFFVIQLQGLNQLIK